MDFTGKRVLIVGTKKSGMAALGLLKQHGAQTILYDGNEQLSEEDIRSELPPGVETDIRIGTLSEKDKEAIELIVISPGVPIDSPLVLEFQERKVPIWGEVELAYAFEKGKVLAITGTNGKTTTTALLGQIMQDATHKAFTVGNIGIPYTQMVSGTEEDSVTVAEISSFQLETVHAFRPAVSAILNITPDHLNRHHTMECYVQTKERIAAMQTKAETCVLNYEDSYTRQFGLVTTARPVYFSGAHELENGFYYKDGVIYKAEGGKATRLLAMSETHLLGVHNAENIMAAVAMADSYGIAMEQILESVKSFHAVEHRLEFVATKRGVDYYNDSKGTNPDAAIKGIGAMVKPTFLIGGGYDKGSEYDEWIESFDGKVKKLVLIGQTREKIADCAKRHGFEDYVFAESLEEAMELCIKEAKEGDCVLLSPACASWGMFPNYEVRGNRFKDMVLAIEEK
ncbi:MAG: UDP-N-acetylmuramoyl-L-alanine--D-glutamate ligase [Lachnospiraceae bacterium]|nr:UDP-N-acetylmuramoyl-L-alanine--D-glutamate ligase [Lachnospiraceae bacterium]